MASASESGSGIVAVDAGCVSAARDPGGTATYYERRHLFTLGEAATNSISLSAAKSSALRPYVVVLSGRSSDGSGTVVANTKLDSRGRNTVGDGGTWTVVGRPPRWGWRRGRGLLRWMRGVCRRRGILAARRRITRAVMCSSVVGGGGPTRSRPPPGRRAPRGTIRCECSVRRRMVVRASWGRWALRWRRRGVRGSSLRMRVVCRRRGILTRQGRRITRGVTCSPWVGRRRSRSVSVRRIRVL